MTRIQQRLQDIEGWLGAYRVGWVRWDPVHVRKLERERRLILRLIGD